MAEVDINHEKDKCIGCGACVAICPVKVWEMGSDGKSNAAQPWNRCVLCMQCQNSCPVQCIKIEPK